ncbi:hypothetical protein OIDMADRAFT_19284 [Oidiodendron maius Zn]|uniref:Uncharacterized protein n=1 Tax=Oidiodendron maius (strain Zn) TaxID=913774 RepID=A0A0C3HE34_OIDMZ|nr:hypothetical protein OIDMADRAFT_19284 [Oidiodendron maius Zn]
MSCGADTAPISGHGPPYMLQVPEHQQPHDSRESSYDATRPTADAEEKLLAAVVWRSEAEVTSNLQVESRTGHVTCSERVYIPVTLSTESWICAGSW